MAFSGSIAEIDMQFGATSAENLTAKEEEPTAFLAHQ
jgi:hypothetical protein